MSLLLDGAPSVPLTGLSTPKEGYPLTQLRTPREGPPPATQLSEEGRTALSRSIIARAVDIVEEGYQIIKMNDEVKTSSGEECTKSNERSVTLMGMKLSELAAEKKALEQQHKEIERGIEDGKASKSKAHRKLRAHDTPLQTLTKQINIRDQHRERDHFRDAVSDRIEEQVGALRRSATSIAAQVDNTRDVIEELSVARQHVSDALKLKNMALKIDSSCAKVTLSNVSAHYIQIGHGPAERALGTAPVDPIDASDHRIESDAFQSARCSYSSEAHVRSSSAKSRERCRSSPTGRTGSSSLPPSRSRGVAIGVGCERARSSKDVPGADQTLTAPTRLLEFAKECQDARSS
jgi:hypothetical protein